MEPLWTAVAGHRALLAAISILNPADPLALQVRVDDAGHVVPAPDAEPFSFRDEKSGRFPTVATLLVKGERSATVYRDGASETLDHNGPYGAVFFDVYNRT